MRCEHFLGPIGMIDGGGGVTFWGHCTISDAEGEGGGFFMTMRWSA
jgi:hypothetical protein